MSDQVIRLKDLAFLTYDEPLGHDVTPVADVDYRTRIAVAQRLVKTLGDEAKARGDMSVEHAAADANGALWALLGAIKASGEAELAR